MPRLRLRSAVPDAAAAAPSSQQARLLQPPHQAPPDITVPMPPVNGTHLTRNASATGLANSSHLGDGSESEVGAASGAPPGRSGSTGDLWSALSWGRTGAGSGGAGGRANRGGFRSALAKLFSKGHDVEAAGSNHVYTREERARLKQFQSIDYLAPSSRVYRHWLGEQPYGRYWDRWLMMAFIGMAVGLVGFSLHTLVHVLASTKYHGTRWAERVGLGGGRWEARVHRWQGRAAQGRVMTLPCPCSSACTHVINTLLWFYWGVAVGVVLDGGWVVAGGAWLTTSSQCRQAWWRGAMVVWQAASTRATQTQSALLLASQLRVCCWVNSWNVSAMQHNSPCWPRTCLLTYP